MSKMLVRDEECTKYIINSEDLIHGYWFNSDHGFDIFFNDIEDYYAWKEYCETDDDTYRILDEYIQDQGKEYSGFPCEEAASIDELDEIMDFNYHWNSYNDTVTKISDVSDLAYYLTSELNAIESYYFMKWNTEYNYNQQIYVEILQEELDTNSVYFEVHEEYETNIVDLTLVD